MDPQKEHLLVACVMGVMLIVLALSGWQNFTLRQENAELRATPCPTSPVNCPTPDWFTGRRDQQ